MVVHTLGMCRLIEHVLVVWVMLNTVLVGMLVLEYERDCINMTLEGFWA